MLEVPLLINLFAYLAQRRNLHEKYFKYTIDNCFNTIDLHRFIQRFSV